MANNERVLSSIFTNTQVREFIQYFQCGKIQCLYSERALSAEDKIACQIAIYDWDYNCGSPFVQRIIFYTTNNTNNGDTCYRCKHNNELAEPLESLKLKYNPCFHAIHCDEMQKRIFCT
ncbi:9477_t:CDS:2 [Funneliformis caledonium]|uniref:9477_t:CDS:1 n=1 Tax=Funneliformis caledonium TaxID=1117310 RepID=A0A9N8ZU51_9GLOM|nr:9477_t:CDS:2 [Funneliformis caledonium]